MAGKSGVITKISLRNLGAHKVRFFLTILSVLLGTAFIAGSFIFTNSLQKSFDGVVSSSYEGVDAIIEPGKESDQGLDLKLKERLEADPKVDAVNISTAQQVVLVKDGEQTLSTGGAPSVTQVFYPPEDAVGPEVTVVEGEAPSGPNEIVVNQTAAEKHGLKVGDSLTMIDPVGRHEAKISGFYSLDMSVGGFIGALMDEKSFLETYRPNGVVDQFMVHAKDSDGFLEDLKQTYPGFDIRGGDEAAAEETEQINQALSFVNYFLIAFGLIALLVGTFIIANTFSMIVAQRLREFALLRSLGASRRQITVSVVVESVIIGLTGSLLGVLAGVGLVKLIYFVMEKFDMGLPETGLGLTPAAVAVPLVLGVIVTVLSAWAPARRAGQVHPVEAMRMGDVSSSSSLKLRTILGAVVLVAGIVAAIIGGWVMSDADTDPRASVVGVGAVLVILGTFMISPALSIPFVPVLGRIIGASFGSVGKLASTNSKRNPRRTATTAFALTLGVALVGAIGMFGATMKNSVTELTDTSVTAEYIISGPTSAGQGQFPVPRDAVDAVRKTESVDNAATLGMAPLKVGSSGQPFRFVIDGDPRDVTNVEAVEGDVSLAKPGVIVSEKMAKDDNLRVGQKLPVVSGTGAKAPLMDVPVTGIYKDNDLLGPMILGQSAVDRAIEDNPQLNANGRMNTTIQFIAANPKPGVDSEQFKQDLDKALEEYVILTTMTKMEFAGSQAVMVDQMLNILYGLLALAIIVAILGIINTLALNVVERRQEVGMLRAVGMKRMQVRTMITLEAVQIAIYGAIVGVVIGVFLGWAFIKVLADQGLGSTVVPWAQLAWMILGSAVVGVIAALWPAHKASRTPPLEAIAD